MEAPEVGTASEGSMDQLLSVGRAALRGQAKTEENLLQGVKVSLIGNCFRGPVLFSS